MEQFKWIGGSGTHCIERMKKACAHMEEMLAIGAWAILTGSLFATEYCYDARRCSDTSQVVIFMFL